MKVLTSSLGTGTFRGTGRGLVWDTEGRAVELVDLESVSLSGRPCDLTGCASSTDP